MQCLSSLNVIFGFDFDQSPQTLFLPLCARVKLTEVRNNKADEMNFFVNTVFTDDRQTVAERQLTQNKQGKLAGPSKCLWWLDTTTPSKHCKITTVLISLQHQQQATKVLPAIKTLALCLRRCGSPVEAAWLLPPSCDGERREVASQHKRTIKVNILMSKNVTALVFNMDFYSRLQASPQSTPDMDHVMAEPAAAPSLSPSAPENRANDKQRGPRRLFDEPTATDCPYSRPDLLPPPPAATV